MTTVPELSGAERLILLSMRPLEAIGRPAVHGRPFRILGRNLASPAAKLAFREDVVLGLVGRGLLTVTQAAGEIVGRTAKCPFSVILSKEGENVRIRLIADRPTEWRAAANDAAAQVQAA